MTMPTTDTRPFMEITGSEYWLKKFNVEVCANEGFRYIRGSRDRAWVQGDVTEEILKENKLEGKEVEPVAFVTARCGQFVRDGNWGNGEGGGRTYLTTHQNSCTKCKAVLAESESPEETLLREAQETGDRIASTPGLEDYAAGEQDDNSAFTPFIIELQGKLYRCEAMASDLRGVIQRLREISPDYQRVFDMVE